MAGKYKKRSDGRYLVQVQIGIKDNGKPKFKNVYGRTIRELEEKVAITKQELKSGIFIDDQGLTLGEWAKKWLETYKANVEYNTFQMYKTSVYNHIIPDLGQYKLKNLKAHHIQESVNKKAADGYTKTISVMRSTLGQILKQAYNNDLVVRNVMESVEFPTPRKKKKRMLTEDEKIYITKANFDLRRKAFVYTLLYTGIRRGEILALNKGDIDLKKKTLNVDKVVIFINGKPVIKDYPKSDAGTRVIFIPDILLEILKEYIPTVKSLILFPSSKNALMSQSAYKSMWDRVLKDLNTAAGGNNEKKYKYIAIANDITPHIFRHTYATSLYYAGIDIKSAQYLLGHASAEVTMEIYTHLDMENNTKVNEKINNFCNESVNKIQSKFSQNG